MSMPSTYYTDSNSNEQLVNTTTECLVVAQAVRLLCYCIIPHFSSFDFGQQR